MRNSKQINFSANFYPQNYPLFMNGKLTYKVKLKKDYVRHDGTCAVYIQMFLDGCKKMYPLNFSVAIRDFDDKKQRVKPSHTYYKDYNLLIEKKLADINAIEVNYRLSNRTLSIEYLINDLDKPTSRMDFIQFWSDEMERQKELLKPGTYKQQISVLQKLKNYKAVVLFNEIDENFIEDFRNYCAKKLKNKPATVATTMKSFKKYLHMANKKGIATPAYYTKIQNKKFVGNRVFLMPYEVKKLFKYWSSEFISDTHKNILDRFLFSCFTGVRFSDNQNLKLENFIDNNVVFIAEKTGKLQRIPLNDSAKKFVGTQAVFNESFTGEYMNRELKIIAQFLKINKNISFHVSRHTFATNFYMATRDVLLLQKYLGHSKLEETLIYVHIVEQMNDVKINSMDEILL